MCIRDRHEILENEDVCKTIGAKHYEKLTVNHDVVNFVDDSNSVITADPGVDIEDYTRNYFNLLGIYYNSQKLKINTDKTQLMVCSKPRYMDQIENMEIETSDETENVKPQAQIKILGYLFNTRGNIDNQVNKLKSSCYLSCILPSSTKRSCRRLHEKVMFMHILYPE